MKRNRILATLAVLAATSVGALAQATANADVMDLVNDSKATFDAVLPIALTVLGTFIAISIGVRTWNKVS